MARAAAAAAAAAAASAVRDAGAPGARAHGSRTVYAYVLILTVYAYDKLNLRLSTGRRRTDRKDRKSGVKSARTFIATARGEDAVQARIERVSTVR
jgi:hypothetical protein